MADGGVRNVEGEGLFGGKPALVISNGTIWLYFAPSSPADSVTGQSDVHDKRF